MSERTAFDRECKKLVAEIGEYLQYISQSQYSIDSQTVVKSVMKFKPEWKSPSFTVDVVWLENLCKTLPKTYSIMQVISDVIVAWEIDATSSRKAIRASIDNLATLNPRLGVELLLIGGNVNAIRNYEPRLKTALLAARMKNARIIVITDVIFSQLYFSVTYRHPQSLYDIYLRIASKDAERKKLLKKTWEDLSKRTKMDKNFKSGLREKLLDKL
jgi:hypothetical protein